MNVGLLTEPGSFSRIAICICSDIICYIKFIYIRLMKKTKIVLYIIITYKDCRVQGWKNISAFNTNRPGVST